MDSETIEGIVLRSQEYKERQRIVTLFTPLGALSLIIKGVSCKQGGLLSLTTPFSHGEYHFSRGRSDLLRFQDGTILNEYLTLRSSLEKLRTAGALAQALLRSQMPGKSAPALFVLYKAYHHQVSLTEHPRPLLASFYVKLLKHEGLWNDAHLDPCFSSLEGEVLRALSQAQRFSALSQLSVPDALIDKLYALVTHPQ